VTEGDILKDSLATRCVVDLGVKGLTTTTTSSPTSTTSTLVLETEPARVALPSALLSDAIDRPATSNIYPKCCARKAQCCTLRRCLPARLYTSLDTV
jgi:hypothetical protein